MVIQWWFTMTEETNHFQQIQSNAVDCPPQNKQGIQTQKKRIKFSNHPSAVNLLLVSKGAYRGWNPVRWGVFHKPWSWNQDPGTLHTAMIPMPQLLSLRCLWSSESKRRVVTHRKKSAGICQQQTMPSTEGVDDVFPKFVADTFPQTQLKLDSWTGRGKKNNHAKDSACCPNIKEN